MTIKEAKAIDKILSDVPDFAKALMKNSNSEDLYHDISFLLKRSEQKKKRYPKYFKTAKK